MEGWLRCLATVYSHLAIQTRKTAGKGARLILDWPYEQTLYLLVWTTVWGLTDREGEKILLPTHMTLGPRGMETGTYATSTRQTTKSLSWVSAET